MQDCGYMQSTALDVKCVLQTDLGQVHSINCLQSIGALMEALQHLHCQPDSQKVFEA